MKEQFKIESLNPPNIARIFDHQIRKLRVLMLRRKGEKLSGINLENGDIRGKSMKGADLRNSNLRNVKHHIPGRLFGGRSSFEAADLGGANLKGVFLTFMNFKGANLRGVNLQDQDLSHSNFKGADLQETNLRGADLMDTNFKGADLRGANLENINYFNESILVNTELDGIQISLTTKSPYDRVYCTPKVAQNWQDKTNEKRRKNGQSSVIFDTSKISIKYFIDNIKKDFYSDITRPFGLIEYIEKNRLQDSFTSAEDRALLGNKLIELYHSNPEARSKLYHIIIEIAEMLNNNLRDNLDAPYIPQQVIIQMDYLNNSKDVNISNGSMFGRIIGKINESMSVEYVDNKTQLNPRYSPHKDFAAASLGIEKIFAIRAYDQKPFRTINKYSKGEILNSIKVRPIGVANDFYHAFYETEEGLVIKICLYLSRTEGLFEEGKKHVNELDHKQISQLDTDLLSALGKLTSVNEKDKFISIYDIKDSEQMIMWLGGELNKIPNFKFNLHRFWDKLDMKLGEDNKNNKTVQTLTKSESKENSEFRSWQNIMTFIVSQKDNISNNYSEGAYQLIKWRIESVVATQSKDKRNNIDAIRLITADDKDVFYKICDTLLKSILSGDADNNSHQNLIRNKMSIIQGFEKNDVVKPSLILIYESGETKPCMLNFDIDERLEGSFEAKKLKDYNPQFWTEIILEYKIGNYISINNVKYKSIEELESAKFVFGDNIRFCE
jgi:Pentapeptide repeats (8 copies)